MNPVVNHLAWISYQVAKKDMPIAQAHFARLHYLNSYECQGYKLRVAVARLKFSLVSVALSPFK